MFASTIAVACLLCLALPLSYDKKIPQRNNGIILLTEGADHTAKNLKEKKYTLDPLLRDRSTTVISDLHYFLAANPWVRKIDIYGYGLSPSFLEKLSQYQLVFHPSKGPTGITHIGWQSKIKSGEPLIIQGSYQNNGQEKVKLILKGLGKQIDSLLIPVGTQKSFSFKSYPKQLGKAVYQLISLDQRDTLANEPLPFVTVKEEQMKILVLASFPDFEYKFLKRWLFENHYPLVFRTKISKQKYSFDFLNTDSVNLTHINAGTLKKFDLLLADEEELNAISPNEKLAVSKAVDDGLGLLLRISGNKPLTTVASAFSRYESPLVQNKKLNLRILESGYKLNTLPLAQTLFLAEKRNHQPLVKDQNAKILVASTIQGLGKVVATSVSSTYNWMLSGKALDYATYWSHLISKSARREKEQTSTQLIPRFPVIHNKVRVVVDLNESAAPPILKFSKKSLAPRQNMELPFEWDATFWPKASGWSNLEINQQIQNFYVFQDKDWRALRNQELININQQASNQTKNKVEEAIGSTTITHTISKWWFFIGIILATGFLWLESRWSKV